MTRWLDGVLVAGDVSNMKTQWRGGRAVYLLLAVKSSDVAAIRRDSEAAQMKAVEQWV